MAYFPEGGKVSVWRDPLIREDYEGLFVLSRFVRAQGNAEWWEGQFVSDEFGEDTPKAERETVVRKLVRS